MIKMKRRRENKTDYNSRITMLKSNLPRIIFRKTNRYILGAYIKSKTAQDSTIVSVNSKELIKYGWMGYSIKNLSACYLTGLLLGKKVIESKGNKEVILDIGLLRNFPGSKIYSFVKGLKDAGLDIKCDEKMFPSEERIKGKDEKTVEIFEKIKKDLETHFKTINKEKKE